MNALNIVPFDEKAISHYLRSLLEQGKNDEALNVCKNLESLFCDDSGLVFSQSFKEMVNSIILSAHAEDEPLTALLDSWREEAAASNAYYCNLNVFKSLYQIEARTASRTKRKAYVVSLNVRHELETEAGRIIKKLERLIPGVLRKGDLYTRSGLRQFMLMLFDLTQKNCESVVKRITGKLKPKYHSDVLDTAIAPVVPIEHTEDSNR